MNKFEFRVQNAKARPIKREGNPPVVATTPGVMASYGRWSAWGVDQAQAKAVLLDLMRGFWR